MHNLEQLGYNEFMEPSFDSAAAEYKEQEMLLHEASVLAPDGLGYGEGTISAAEVEATLTEEEKAALDAAPNSPKFLIDVTSESDGCGDGRAVNKVIENEKVVDTDSTRKKVFGGGAAMMAASFIGNGMAKGNLSETFTTSMSHLRAKGIEFGAHTDNHAKGENCGCGAIDKAPTAIANITKYQNDIRTNMALLGQDAEITEVVLKNFADYGTVIAENTEYTGADVMGQILKSGKMVKELADGHLEARVYLNFVPGKTVNQGFIRQATNGKAQAFSVDVYRMVEIAEKAFAYPENATEEQVEQTDLTRKTAVASQVAYTLGVAATLTKGDIPVVLVNPVTVEQPIPIAA